jgi:hypothetical protein
MAYCFAGGELSWRISCNILNRWRVSDDESRRVVSEGEGACSLLFKVRSHLPLRGKLGWMTPRVGVKTTLTNGNAPLGALVPKQGPHFFAVRPHQETHPIRDNKWDGEGGRPCLPQSGISAYGRWAIRFDLSEFHGESPALIHLLGRRNVQLM